MQNLIYTGYASPAHERWIIKRCRVSPEMARLIAELLGFKSGDRPPMNAGVPLWVDCRHAHDERRPAGSGPAIRTCNRFRSLADGVTRIACDAVRNFRCGLAGTGLEAKDEGSAR
jgi:hypothetical protein